MKRIRLGWMSVLAAAASGGVANAAERINVQTPQEREEFFGDLHIHTTYSNDAFGLNNNRMPDVA